MKGERGKKKIKTREKSLELLGGKERRRSERVTVKREREAEGIAEAMAGLHRSSSAPLKNGLPTQEILDDLCRFPSFPPSHPKFAFFHTLISTCPPLETALSCVIFESLFNSFPILHVWFALEFQKHLFLRARSDFAYSINCLVEAGSKLEICH